MGLFFSSVGEYKSSWYEIARNLFRSRNNQRARAELLAEEARELRLRNEQLRHKSEETKKQLEQTKQLLQQQIITKLTLMEMLLLPEPLRKRHHSFFQI